MQPLSIVDSVSFIRFVQTLDPRYTMHSRNYYTRSAIPQKYEEIKALVKDDLEKAEHISATTDMDRMPSTKLHVSFWAFY